MAGIQVAVAPAREPVTNSEAKEYLRLDEDIDDLQVASLIVAAREWCEKFTGRALITRTVHQFVDANIVNHIPLQEGFYTGVDTIVRNHALELTASPAQSVTSISYFNKANVETNWSNTNWYADTFSEVPRIFLTETGTFPSDLRRSNSLKIVYTAGFGATPQTFPDPIRIAMLQYMTFMYEHRGDFERFPPPQPPKILDQLLQPYQIMRFSAHSLSAGQVSAY